MSDTQYGAGSRKGPARGADLSAIATATGWSWEDWTAWLEAHGARELPDHGAIVELVLSRLTRADVPPAAGAASNPPWWAQSVTVAYEQHLGRRLPGQRADGTFDVTASRTLAGSREDAYARVLAALRTVLDGEADQLRGVGLAKDPTESVTAKRRFWRAVLADGSRAEVAVESRPAGADGAEKAAAVATQSKVASPEEAAAWKGFWKDLLGEV